MMLIDDSGFSENKPVNPVVSYFYGADEHGGITVGDVILGVERSPYNFPLKHPETVKRLLMERFPSLWEA